MPDSNILFISHTAVDRPYAVALEAAIEYLLENDPLIKVNYSTSDEAGPQGGEQWRDWIYRQVVGARTALIVVTPHALGKPWLLWEAGACRGAALAQTAGASVPADKADGGGIGVVGRRLNISVAYGLTENECPDPLRGDQIIPGADVEKMTALLGQILQFHGVPSRQLLKAGGRMEEALDQYMARVKTLLLQAPSLVTEANVQDWLSRLDELIRSNRLSELPSFQRWMMLAFGRDGEAATVPIDVRLHRRLGELYLREKEFVRAAEQLQLARRAAPRDIYVLRPLAEVSMKRLLADQTASHGNATHDEIQSLLDAIEELDDRAFVATPDAAALRGKYLRRVCGQPEQAVDVYRKALDANPGSYYLADLLAQTELDLGRLDAARDSFRKALEIVEHLGEHNIWCHATGATASLAIDDPAKARTHLAAIAALGPNKSEADTIRDGFSNVAKQLGISPAVTEQLLLAMTGREPAPVGP